MTRVLVRAGIPPFTAIGYEDTLSRNILGTDLGRFFAEEICRFLSTKYAQNHTFGYSRKPASASDINRDCDVLVLPFAIAMRNSYLALLRKNTESFENLNFPVVVASIGAQVPIGSDVSAKDSICDDVRAFFSGVLKRSNSIGLRSEYTQKFLFCLGFAQDQVNIIGCPSMYLKDQKLSKIQKNCEPNDGDMILRHHSCFEN